MKTKKYLFLALCIFILGTFISACGGGGKSTPPSYPFIPVPTPTPTVSPTPTPTPTVSPAPAKYPLELSQTEFTVNVGATDNIVVMLNGEDITQTAIYTVDQEAIATVEGGLITGFSAGFATVTVNAENAESEKTFTVNVIDPTLPTLEVSQTEFNLFVDDEAKIEVTLEGKDVTKKVTYTSDEESIAIAEKGRIEAKDKGTAKIAVSLEGANSASFTVNVKEPISVTLNNTVLDQLHELGIIAKSYADRKELEEIDIPATFTYEGTKYKIISIDYRLFSNCTSLKKVTLPDSLETITQRVFENCSSLEEITIRDDVVCIFPSSFLNCPNLTKLTTKSGKEINIPENDIETVDDITFIGVKLEPDPQGSGYSTITNVTIPNGITKIPNSAFNYCTSLENVTIGNSVTTIERDAFSNCSNSALNIDIQNSVTSIGYDAFYNLNNINISEEQKTLEGYPWGAKKINGQDIEYHTVTLNNTVLDQLHELGIIAKGYDDRQELTEIDIPATFTYEGTRYKITSIAKFRLFYNCTSLKKVTLPDSLETISNFAFENCSSLEEITIRDDVFCIFPSAFLNCPNLTKLTTKSGKEINIPENDVETVDNVTFIGVKLQRDSNIDYPTITNVIIPNGLTEIPAGAFQSCQSLPNITIPNSVKTIGDNAFNACTSFTRVIIPDSVINIGYMAFGNCISLGSVNIGKSVTTIGRYAFYNCSSLKNVTIPDNVITIEGLAFMDCYLLESVNIGKNVATIGQEAFENCRSLKSVTIPDSVITIDTATFYGCTSLGSVTIGKSVTTIKWGAFYNCTNPDLSIDIATSNVTSIVYEAFYNVNNIKISEKQKEEIPDDPWDYPWGAKSVTIVNPQNN